MTRRLLVLALLAVVPGPAAAENRVEGLSSLGSVGRRPLELVEMDLQLGAAVGMRATGLGSRDTYEAYVRKIRGKEKGALDPRDNRSAVQQTTRRESAYHLGLVGLELDGARGLSQVVRAGISEVMRTGPKSSAVAEIDYQSGTFGGDGTGPRNSAGVYTRFGLRQDLSKSFYAVGDYSFSPGERSGWTPQLRLGFTF